MSGRTPARLLGEIARRGRRVRDRMPDGVKEAVWLFVTLRVALTLLGIAVWATAIQAGPCAEELEFGDWSRIPALESGDPEFMLLGQWQRFDACWYLKIATFGYEPGAPDITFFPLFPALVAATGWLTFGNLVAAGMVVAGIGYMAAVAGIIQLISRDFDRDVAERTALYLSVFPAAFFLLAPFSESLLLALAVWAIYLARTARWGWTALIALLAGLARPQGALLVLPIAWEVVRWWRARPRGAVGAQAPASSGRSSALEAAAGAAAVLAPVVGALGFAAAGAATTGVTPLEAQRHWNVQQIVPPWEVLGASFEYAVRQRDVIQAANLGSILLAFGLLALGARGLPGAYTVFALAQLAVVVTRLQPVPLMSTTRYVLVIFPVFVVLALLGRHRRFHVSWLIMSVLGLGYFTYMFLIGRFVA